MELKPRLDQVGGIEEFPSNRTKVELKLDRAERHRRELGPLIEPRWN